MWYTRLSACIILYCVLGTAAWCVPVRILVTGDMHGQFIGQAKGANVLGGVAEMLDFWQREEGYTPQNFLVVSCGDNAGGTLCDQNAGAPAVDVMNAMGYDISAIGTHYFDYGIDGLKNMMTRAKFPYLAANVLDLNGARSTLAPATMLYIEQGIKVGIIGLAKSQPYPAVNLTASPYSTVVREQHAKLKASGAQMTIVVAHAPLSELEQLAIDVADLYIPVILGGYSHAFSQKLVKNSLVVCSGDGWTGYTRVDVEYCPSSRKAMAVSGRQVTLLQAQPAPAAFEITTILQQWQ